MSSREITRIKDAHLKRNGVALKKRAELIPIKAINLWGRGILNAMVFGRARFGIGFALIGAWITCTALKMMGILTFGALLPAMLYLGLGTLLMGILAAMGLQIHRNALSLNKGIKRQALFGAVLPRTAKFLAANYENQGDGALLGHDIKNYLCTLKGNAQLLRQRGATDAQGLILDRIDRVVEKLEEFAGNLGTTPQKPNARVGGEGRAGVGTGGRNRVPMKLGEAARQCAGTHFHHSPEFFTWDTGEEDSEILGDSDRFDQVFLNLYMNAREAGARKVSTVIRRKGNFLSVTVEDDGKGCHPKDLKRIFEPFFSTKGGPARRGLGMFIVQSLVENHGGKMSVRTKSGTSPKEQGLVFTLEFPIWRSMPEPMAPTRTPSPFSFGALVLAKNHHQPSLPAPI